MKKLFLVMNPYAGTRKANRVLAELLTMFNRAGYETVVHMTAGPGDGAREVCLRGGEMDLIVAVGGDGTLNEVITGVLRCGAQVPLGYIPCGSTNDFAASLRLPSDILEAARAILEGEPRLYDVGAFGDRNFSYVASFGAFTRAAYETPQNVKNALGHLAYILTGAKELFQLPRECVSFSTDAGDFFGEYMYGAVSNSTSVGGILTLDPKVVDMQDGRFEMMLVQPPKNPVELMGLVQALTTQKYDSPLLTFRSVRKLTVRCDPQMPWTLDGEKFEGAGEISIENLHHAIRLVMPK